MKWKNLVVASALIAAPNQLLAQHIPQDSYSREVYEMLGGAKAWKPDARNNVETFFKRNQNMDGSRKLHYCNEIFGIYYSHVHFSRLNEFGEVTQRTCESVKSPNFYYWRAMIYGPYYNLSNSKVRKLNYLQQMIADFERAGQAGHPDAARQLKYSREQLPQVEREASIASNQGAVSGLQNAFRAINRLMDIIGSENPKIYPAIEYDINNNTSTACEPMQKTLSARREVRPHLDYMIANATNAKTRNNFKKIQNSNVNGISALESIIDMCK